MDAKKVLVTGGAGFIGSELVSQVQALGHKVCVVDNLRNGKKENIAPLLGKNVELFVEDIRDREAMASLLSRVDVVFHLACLGVRHSLHSPIENHSVNAKGTLTLLDLAKSKGVKKFVYVSSSEVYGTATMAPMSEAHPTFPLTVYGASKLAGECYARAFYSTYRLPVVILRPFNTFGPRSHHEGDSGEVIPKFMLRCLAGKEMVVFGRGSQTRDFTYVGDMAKNILGAGFSEKAVGQTINLGSGREISILELAQLISSVLKKEPFIRHDDNRPGDVMRLCADSTRAKEIFDFKVSTGLQEGLIRLRDWYLQSGSTPEALLHTETPHNWEAPWKN